jgi:hypothetical protein
MTCILDICKPCAVHVQNFDQFIDLVEKLFQYSFEVFTKNENIYLQTLTSNQLLIALHNATPDHPINMFQVERIIHSIHDSCSAEEYVQTPEYTIFLLTAQLNHESSPYCTDWDTIFKTFSNMPENSYNRSALQKGNNKHCMYLLSLKMEVLVGIYPDFVQNLTPHKIHAILQQLMPEFSLTPRYFISQLEYFWRLNKWPLTYPPFSEAFNSIKNQTLPFQIHELPTR